MIPSYTFWVGLRYTQAKRRNSFISIISGISMVGVALGVMALIVVISVMNGFEKELRARILAMTSHALITGVNQRVENWPLLDEIVQKNEKVVATAPYIEVEVMLSHNGEVQGALLRGIIIDREKQVSKVEEAMLAGHLEALKPGEYGVIIGRELAFTLGLSLGDKVMVITPQSSVSPIGITPRLRRFTIVGIFEYGMHLYDNGMGYIHIEDAQKLLRFKEDEVSGLRLELEDMFDAPKVVRDIALNLGGAWRVNDWTRQHANFFKAVKMEKTVMFVILALIVGVAAFNIVSTLVMMVTDKRADIAILRTIGATPSHILWIFMIQGTLIGVIGTFIGVVLGVGIALNIETIVPALEQLFHQDFLSGDVYYLSELPSDLHWEDVWKITGLSLVLSFIATIYPALRAANTQPAEALRYE